MFYISLQKLFEENEKETIEDNLLKRNVDPNKIYVIIDKESNLATFLLYNLSGKLIGYQQYNPNGSKKIRQSPDEKFKDVARYWTYVTKGERNKRELAVWGLESFNNSKELFVTEGIFDAIKIQNAGYAAVAVLANNPEPLTEWFRIISKTKRIISILDNDDNESGNLLAKFGSEYYKTPDPWKDLGDMPQEKVNLFLDKIINSSFIKR